MKIDPKKDPWDYTLKEAAELCKYMDNCDGCPLDGLRGPCYFADFPEKWDVPALKDDFNPEAVARGVRELVDGIARAKEEFFNSLCEILKAVAADRKTEPAGGEDGKAAEVDADMDTCEVTFYGGESATVEIWRGQDD